MSEIYRNDFAVLTMSDSGSRGERIDTSGEWIIQTLQEAGFQHREYRMIADQHDRIAEHLRIFADDMGIALVITTGGTGLSPTDHTPEATAEVIEKEIPGIAEAMRAASLLKTNRAMLSRGKAGVRGETLIINLPGSLKAVQENLAVVLDVLPHALSKIQGDTGHCGQGDS